MDRLHSINYDRPLSSTSKSLFEFWESGEFPLNMSTPSVALSAYRDFILEVFRKYSKKNKDRIISVGSGNGFVEIKLQNSGYTILASDINYKAVEIMCNKGLNGIRFDVINDDYRKLGTADIIYADGLMGHLWNHGSGYAILFKRFYQMLNVGGILIVSNDLCDEDSKEGSLSVNADTSAQFYRPLPGYVASQARQSGLYSIIIEEIFLYNRHGRGLRRREIVVCEKY